MINYKKELIKQLQEIKSLKEAVDIRLNKDKKIERGKIRVSTNHGCPQYYYKKEGETKERYVPTYEKDMLHMQIQRDYDERVYKELTNLETKLTRFLKTYDIDHLNKIYDNMCLGRQKYIMPVLQPKDEYVEEWIKSHKGGQNTGFGDGEFMTVRGEMVRSKSEKILADYFYSVGIPYQIEPRFVLLNGSCVYPDFVLLNLKNLKTIYWEHLGLVEKDGYATGNYFKLMDYEDSGLIIGDSLIITMETKERPLDIRTVIKKVDAFFG